MRKALTIAGLVVVGLFVFALAAVTVFTNTDYGRERVRRLAQSGVQGAAKHGIVRIGRVSGNLLTGFTIDDISITDSAGAPLFVAERVSTKYGLRALARRRIDLTDVRLVRPLVVLDRPPGGDWNYEAIFEDDQPDTPRDTTAAAFGDYISLRDVEIVDGRVVVRTPWSPDDDLRGPARDSAAAAALGGATRQMVVRRDAGFQQVQEYRSLTGWFPYIRLMDRGNPVRRFEVDSARLVALPFRPPAADVRRLSGVFEMTDDSLWFRDARLSMPRSNLALTGRFDFDSSHFDLSGRAAPVAGSDVQFAMPTLPSELLASANVVVRMRGDTNAYTATGADVRLDSARVTGDVGIVQAGGTIAFRDTDVRAERFPTRTIERIVPDVELPVNGLVSGRAALDGPLSDLTVDADVTFDEARSGRSRVVAVGGVGLIDRGVRAENLRLTLQPVQVGLARVAAPDLPIGGAVTGTATVDGATTGTLRARLDLTHVDRGRTSRISGRTDMRLAGGQWFDAELLLRPLSLAEVGLFAPAVGLRGTAAGPVRATGSLRDLAVRTSLRLSDGGRLDVRGRLDLASREKGYQLDARMVSFNANAVVAKAPRTSLTATAFARGRGFDPATMRGAFGADLAASTIDTVSIDSLHARVAVADGIARVDSLRASGTGLEAEATGSFGLREGRSGEIAYVVQVDSLQSLRNLLPPGDTGVVAPRPALMARRLERARRDSAAVASANEVARVALGAPGPAPVVVEPVAAVPRDTLAGSARAAGTLRGNIARFDLRGRLGAENVAAQGNTVRRLRAEYAWVGAPRRGSGMFVAADADTVSAAGFALDSLALRATYSADSGSVAVAIHQHEAEDHYVGARYRLHLDHKEVHFDDLRLRFDTTLWRSVRPGAVQWGRGGIEVRTVDLRSGTTGRVFVDGRLPTDGNADLTVAVNDFQLADIASLLQSDLRMTGLVTATAKVEGPTKEPLLRGAIGVENASFGDSQLPDLRTSFDYAARSLTARGEMLRDGSRPLAVADATIPIYLGIGGEGERLPDGPIRAEIVADSLPIDLIPQFTDVVSDVRGAAAGRLRVAGTTRRPVMAGALAVTAVRARLVPTGVTYRDLTGIVRVAGDTVTIDSLIAHSGGRIALRGGIGIRQISKPSFDLALEAQDARVLDNEMGRVRADASITMKGPFERVAIVGDTRLRSGVLYIPEPDDKDVISTRDPALFSVVDTALIADREVVPGQNPLLENLQVQVTLAVDQDTWVRSSDANVEIFTPPGEPLRISVDRRRSAVVLDGQVTTERGEYDLLGKRFQVRRGSAMFVGIPEINPTLQVTAAYEVRGAGREAMDIRVIIGGTLRRPRLALESDAQPPVSQSDLLSYLAFGRETGSLLQMQGSSVGGASAGGGTGIATAGATFLGQRLAAVALDAFVSDFEGQASRTLGADVFRITPADLYTEVVGGGGGGVSSFFRGTELEVGKYTDPRTFVALQARPTIFASSADERTVPGIRLVRRQGKGFRIEASYEPRFIPQRPTLETERTVRTRAVLGAFLIREWRF